MNGKWRKIKDGREKRGFKCKILKKYTMGKTQKKHDFTSYFRNGYKKKVHNLQNFGVYDAVEQIYHGQNHKLLCFLSVISISYTRLQEISRKLNENGLICVTQRFLFAEGFAVHICTTITFCA